MISYRWHESKTIYSSQDFVRESATDKAARAQALDHVPFFHFMSLFFSHPVALQSWLRSTGHNDATIEDGVMSMIMKIRLCLISPPF